MSFPLSDLAILALATWRLSSLAAQEDGPYRLFARLRKAAGVRYDEHSIPAGGNEFARMILCPWCSSIWFGAALAGTYLLWPAVVWLALPFALSAAAILVHEHISR